MDELYMCMELARMYQREVDNDEQDQHNWPEELNDNDSWND